MGVIPKFGRKGKRDILGYSLNQYAQDLVGYGGNLYGLSPQTTYGSNPQQEPASNFEGIVQGVYKTNGVVFACMVARMLLFAEARFKYRRIRAGRPGELWGNQDLSILEKPWPNGTTGDLLNRMIQDADLCGNFFAARRPNGIKRMHPEWVTIILGSRNDPNANAYDLDAEVVGYLYTPGGKQSGNKSVALLPEEVCHFAPIPDPFASYRGMSWVTPIIREVMGDNAARDHKLKFFENAATPNMVVSLDKEITSEQFKEWIEIFEGEHKGYWNAYKTLYLGGGAQTTVVGKDMHELDFKVTQGAGEPLALDTPVPTPDGWTTMGDLEPGDFVFGRDGSPARVAAVSPVHYDRTCYRVTFSDRTSIVADGGHLWQVIDRNGAGHPRPESVKTTEELILGIAAWRDRKKDGNRYGVPAGRPVDLPERDLLVDPYVLGAWLGDGQTAGAAICGAPADLVFITAEIEARGYTITNWKTAPDKVAVIGIPGGLLAALDALGVLGNKHIPAEYLRASMAQRLDLLRGLMDTDGSVGSIGKESCEFSSKWQALADQVAELARSLGYRVTVSRKSEPRSRTGETWRVTFRADPDVVPFALARKADRCVTPVHVKNRAIVSIEQVESVPVRCIAVETPDHLFRAGEGWTLTHNTRIAAAAGVPPVIVGLSEGLQAATYSNYGQARRRFADMTMRPLWRNAAASMATIVNVPSDSELWYDDRDIPALQDDAKDTALMMRQDSVTIKTLIEAGFDADAVVASISQKDFSSLIGKHTGLVSVQLQPPADDVNLDAPDTEPSLDGEPN